MIVLYVNSNVLSHPEADAICVCCIFERVTTQQQGLPAPICKRMREEHQTCTEACAHLCPLHEEDIRAGLLQVGAVRHPQTLCCMVVGAGVCQQPPG